MWLRGLVVRVVAVAAVCITAAPAWVFGQAVNAGALGTQSGLALAVGTGLAVVAAPVLGRARIVSVFAHELGHFIPALLTGGRVGEFMATDAGVGHVRHAGGWGPGVTLGPYVLPLAALAVASASLLQGTPPAPIWTGCIGLAAGYHLTRVTADVWAALRYGVAGTDLEHLGAFATICWIIALNCLVLTTLAVFCVAGPGGVWVFWGASWDQMESVVRYATDR